MPLLYHAYVYLEFLILACTIYILAPNIIPFIIEDSKKSFYYRGLSEWRREKGWLVDICLDGQDTFVKLLDILEIPHE